jgi:transposase
MKARYHSYTPEQLFIIQINPEDIRRNNPLVAAIDDFIERHISLIPFSSKCINGIKGAPAIHAGMILKVIFYCYAKGCYSSREIEGRTKWDQNVIYLSGNRPLDHSTVCRFIGKYPEEIKDIFSRMVYVLKKIGLVNYDLVAIDGSKIQGYGSKEFTGNIKDFREQKRRIEKKISILLNNTINENPLPEKKLKRWEHNLEKISSFLADAESSGSNDNEHTRINLTDRDARLVKDSGRIYLGYNCQTAAEGTNNIIVGFDVSNNASDRSQLIQMLDEVKKHQDDENPSMKVVADAGYFTSENIEYAEENGIDLYLPEGKNEGGTQKKRKTAGRVMSKDCSLSNSDGVNSLTCPGGFVSTTNDPIHDHGNYSYRFYVPSAYCDHCKYRSKCHNNFRMGKSKRFNVKREYFDSQLARERMKNKLLSPEGRAVYNRRSCIIEHIFGEIKEYKHFRRFYHRGLEKVNTVWAIVCIAHNFRKLARLEYGL